MSNNTTVSVIIPCYNVETCLTKCVRSILSQSLEEIEIILVDDCSPDSTGKLCDTLQTEDSRIKVIHLKQNSGPAQARNAGLTAATGKWITFVDSDDWIEPDTYTVALEYAEKYDAQHVIWSYVSEYPQCSKEKHIYDGDRVFSNETAFQLFADILGPTDSRLLHPEMIHSLSPVWNKLFNADIIADNQLQFFDISYIGPEDLFFSAQYMNCLGKKTSVYIDRCFYHYVKSGGNSISTSYNPSYLNAISNSNTALEKLIENSSDSRLSNAVSNRRALALINIGLNEISSPDGFKPILKRLHGVICEEKYHTAVKSLDFSFLPFKWKLFFFAALIKATFPLFVLLKIMNRMLSKRD